jgi:hypothetical protein
MNLLIACWHFPPHYDIGGRRWAKFAKSLLKDGHRVSVVTPRPSKAGKVQPWIPATVSAGITYYFVKPGFLARWLSDYTSKFAPVKIRLAGFLLKLFYSGTIFDAAIGSRRSFLAATEKAILGQSPHAIIVTGPPFNLLYYVALLKKRYPHLKVLADFRDPWLNAQNFGMRGLSVARRKREESKFRESLLATDIITAPNKYMLNDLRAMADFQPNLNFVELPHAYDPDDRVQATSGKFRGTRIVYGGTLYLSVEPALELIKKSVAYHNQHGGSKPLIIEIFTPDVKKAEQLLPDKSMFRISPPIGNRIFEVVNASDYVLILAAEHNKDYLTSKFFEFLPYGKPYLYFGPEGNIGKTIESEKLGKHVRTEADLHNIINAQIPVEYAPGLDKHTFDFVTRNILIPLLKQK